MTKNNNTYASVQASKDSKEEGLWETVKVIIQALLIAFVVRTFFYQPFNIPSASMYPTLKIGDYLFVSKLSYGYSKYSFNFSFGVMGNTWIKCCSFIDFDGRKVLADVPTRGDVAVFKFPKDTNIDYIKRVIGLPGDRVQMKDGILHINGEPVKKERIEDFFDAGADGAGGGKPVAQYEETLPNGVKYHVLDLFDGYPSDNTEEFLVPPDRYFMMGDNRDNSADSRFADGVGFVPVENMVGRADIIFFSLSPEASLWQFWKWPFAIRWGRFFNLI
jgi:signal peptidase I